MEALLAVRRVGGGECALAVLFCAIAFLTTELAQAAAAPATWTAALGELAAMGADGGRLAAARTAAELGMGIARVVAVAPVGWELLIRGGLYTVVRGRTRASVAMVVTAAVFAAAAFHATPDVMPLAFTIGLALAAAREHTGSVVPAVVAHVLLRALLVALSYAATGWNV